MSDLTANIERVRTSAAVRGDQEAIRALWQSNRRWVAAILLAHKPREADVEDLLQDVAMTVVRTISELRDETALRPWLRTVAINAARASGRKATRARREPRSDGGALPPDNATLTPDMALERREEARRLLDLARQLPEGYREPLILRCVRGMTYAEIARLTGLPETTIETRIARGRRMLRELREKAALGEGGPENAEGDVGARAGRIGQTVGDDGPRKGGPEHV